MIRFEFRVDGPVVHRAKLPYRLIIGDVVVFPKPGHSSRSSAGIAVVDKLEFDAFGDGYSAVDCVAHCSWVNDPETS